MTVSTLFNKEIATGNGLTTSFPFNFGTLPTPDLVVTLFDLNDVGIPQVEGVDYNITGAGQEDGGAVVFVTAPPDEYTVLIQRIIPLTQPTDIKNQGSFYPRTVEAAFGDRNVMIAQQLQERIEASMQLPPQVTGVSTVLPVPEATTLVGWNDAANGLQNFPLASIATSFVYGDKVWNKFAGTGAQTLFVLSEEAGSIGNLDISIDGVTQVPLDDYTLTARNITFLVAPSNGAVILVRFDKALPIGAADASSTAYTPPQTGVLSTVRLFLDALWSSNGANLVRFFQSGTGAFARTVLTKLRETSVSVKDFGAIADGSAHPLSERYGTLAAAQAVYPHATALTDTIDWAAAQAAVNYVASVTSGSARGGWVEFTPGCYVLNQQILIDTNKVVNVRGHGEGTAIRRSNTGRCIELRQNVTIRDLFFVGPLAGTSNGIYCNAANVARIENCTFQNQTTAIQLHDSFAVEIVGNIFDVCYSYGVYADTGAHNTVIERNNFFSCGVANNGSAIAFAVNSDNLKIDGNDFEYCNINITFQDCRSVSVQNNYMEYHSAAWALFGGTCTGMVFESNWIALGSGGGASALLENIVGGRFAHNTIYNQTVNFSTTTLEGFSVGLNRKLGTGTLAKAPWITPTLTNSWAQQSNYSAVGYIKDEYGWVHLRGGLIGGVAGSPCFTLPAGYRPAAIAVFGTASANGVCRISVTQAGVVTPDVAASNNAGLDGISFYVGD